MEENNLWNKLKNVFRFKYETNDTHHIIRILFIKITIKKNKYNKIYIICKNGIKKEVKQNYIKGMRINFVGNKNTCTFYEPLQKFRNCQLTLINGCDVTIEELQNKNIPITGINNLRIRAIKSTIQIGKNLYIGNGSDIYLYENSYFKIGDNCMISEFLRVRGGDGHKIYNNQTKEIVQQCPHIEIGNHVWIGQNVTLLKNAKIAANSIVGTFSIVTKVFNKENVILAGNPAKIVKENVNWEK